MAAWRGTALAGGCYGVLLAAGLSVASAVTSASPVPLNLIDLLGSTAALAAMMGAWGAACAGLVGLAVVPTVVALAWLCWLHRWPRTVAAVAGALTGEICLHGTWWGFGAALIGGLGAAWAMDALSGGRPVAGGRAHWHCSLRDLFVRTTAASALLVFWLLVLRVGPYAWR